MDTYPSDAATCTSSSEAPSKTPLPLTLRNVANVAKEKALPSSEIDKSKLADVETVLQKYKHLCGQGATEGHIRLLCVKLASSFCVYNLEAIFGEVVMKRCTPGGSKDLPSLPYDELYNLKTLVMAQCPQFWKLN